MPITIATFNVKDLIESLLPASPEDATRQAKIDGIAKEIARADPDVIGLQEVGSEGLVRAVFARVQAHRPGAAPYEIVMGTVDSRGIGCALATRLPLLHAKVHQTSELPFPVFHPSDPKPFGPRLPLRRGFVHAKVRAPFGQLHIIVVHFKSRASVPAKTHDGKAAWAETSAEHGEAELRALVWRSAEALFARRILDECFAEQAADASGAPNVILLGDLNDDVRSPPLRIVRGRGETALHGVEEHVPDAMRFTIRHAGRGEQIDHLLVSASLLPRVREVAMQNEALRQHDAPEDDGPPSIDSDHALYKVTLEA
jgi:endonuclease/exonuclease/phosphatase family metal-dependent hydrolase